MAGKNLYYGGIYGAREWSINADTANTAIDLSQSNVYNISLSANTTVSFLNPTSTHYIFVIEQTVGSNTITWPDIKWKSGVPPTLSTTIGSKDTISIIYDGEEYYGFSTADYQTGFRLLDYYPDAAAAYSLRELSQEWIGQPVVRVRRSSDNAERDFTAAEVIDGTMLSWINTDVIKKSSDFSATEDLGEVNGTGAGNIDGIGGVDDCYRLTSSVSGNPQAFYAGLHPTATLTYKVNFDIYIPSSNSTATSFNFLKPNGVTTTTLSPTLDQWTSYEFEELGGGNLTRWILLSASIGDVFYLKNIVITQTTADGHVVTWYDQSGNGRNFTQSTAANQAKLVNAGSLITDNGLPGVQFDNTNDLYTTTSFSIGLVNTAFAVFNANNTGATDELLSGTNYRVTKWTTDNRIVVGYGSGAGQFLDFTESPTAVNQLLLTTFLNNTSTSAIYANGTVKQSATLSPPGAASVSNMGSFTAGVNPFDGIIQEIIIYASDKSADRAAIETAINSHYSIY